VLADLGTTPDGAQFYERSYTSTLKQIVSALLRVEGPIHEDLLASLA